MLISLRVYVSLVVSGSVLRSRALAPLIAGLVAVLVVGLPALFSVDLGASEHVTMLRLVSAVLALGAAFLLDDPANRTTVAVPASRFVRHAAWLTQGLIIASGFWLVALGITRFDAVPADWQMIPALGLTLEAVTLFTTAVAASAWLRATAQGRPGFLGGPALLAVVVAMVLLPRQADFFVKPDDPRWAAMHRIWALLWLASLIALVVASREPVGRRFSQLWPPSEVSHRAATASNQD